MLGQLLACLAGIFLLYNACVMFFFTGFHASGVIVLLLGACLLGYGLLMRLVHAVSRRGIFRWIRIAIFAGVIFVCGLSVFAYLYGNVDTVTNEEDAVIILGAGLKGDVPDAPLLHRLEAAYDYIVQNPDVLVVVSGGQGAGESISEALAMKRYLVSCNISEERIILEDQSTSTSENFRFSKKLLDERLQAPYQITFITNTFHIYRAESLARIAGLDITHKHADLDWYLAVPNYLRECAAIVKMWIFKS